FSSDDELWPIRAPREPLLLEDLAREALDVSRLVGAASLRARTLLYCEWDDGSPWELWVMNLPSGLKVFCDTGAGETRILASGGRHSSDQTDRQFLEVLASTGGERFGIELAGGAPVRVRSPFLAPGGDGDVLVDFFVHLFEVAGTEGSVRDQLHQAGRPAGPGAAGVDFRDAVVSWLGLAASKIE
ncbi:MAG TPA: hypothetical protein VMN39_11145, partial [Longimicrobiaceae bacterium]|nr:hypothetical protein [Longimicrobiaceae bacterium]